MATKVNKLGRNKTKSKTQSTVSNTPKPSNILRSVHATAKGLYDAGLMDKTTMREFDAVCLPQVPNYTPRQIKAIRARCNASQAVFAKYMNITTSSLQKWETGSKRPTGVALKLLSIIDNKGLEALL